MSQVLDEGATLDREALRERAYAVARTVTDPEMPMLTLEDLGVLRAVDVAGEGEVVVAITPTYSGCPAMATMRDDLVHRLTDAGFDDVRIKVELTPAWSSDWITERGRRALAGARTLGAGPRPAPRRPDRPRPVADPRGPSTARAAARPSVELTSEFGADRLQGALPLHRLPRAVRAREGDLMTATVEPHAHRAADRSRCSTRSPSRPSSGSPTTRSRSPSTCPTTWPRRSPSRPASR